MDAMDPNVLLRPVAAAQAPVSAFGLPKPSRSPCTSHLRVNSELRALRVAIGFHIPAGTLRVSRRALPRLQLRGFFDDLVRLDDVAGLDFVPARDHDAALEAVLDLADVVLEAAEAADLALVDLDRVADDPEVRFAVDLAVGDHA